MLCAFAAYATSILFVWYLYEPMILMAFLSISSCKDQTTNPAIETTGRWKRVRHLFPSMKATRS